MNIYIVLFFYYDRGVIILIASLRDDATNDMIYYVYKRKTSANRGDAAGK